MEHLSLDDLPEYRLLTDGAPLSHGQRALWFLHGLAPDSAAYNIAAAVRMLAPVDPAALESAFQALVDRHPGLRTTFFVDDDGEPRQRASAGLRFTLAREDASGWDEARLRARLSEEAFRPFDLQHGPLLRLTLFSGGESQVVLLAMHHIVSDFWSLALLVRELSALYSGATLPPPGASFEDQVRREREALDGPRGEELWSFWKDRLEGLPMLELATDRPRPALQTYRGDLRSRLLPPDLAARLRAFSRRRNANFFMTLVAAVQTLLLRHTGQEDLAIGSPTAGRPSSAFAGVVGYFANPVVLRGDLAGDPSFPEMLARTRPAVQAALEHQDYPLPLLAERLRPQRDTSRTPLFQVSLVWQKEQRGARGLAAFVLGLEGIPLELGEIRAESVRIERMPTPFDLQLHVAETVGGLGLGLQFNADLFDAPTAERLVDRLEVLLRGLAADPERPLSLLPVLSEAERHQLLQGWNDTTAEVAEASVYELFAAQAARTPDAVAVVFEGERRTYGELARCAAALAGRLAALGVGPETVVGVCEERSLELIVGLLAVLAAGGAYLPLEPSLPRERLAALVDDARPPVVLARRSRELPAGEARIVFLDGAVEPPADVEPLPVRVDPDSAAYVIYTSGSTGRPKGVVNSHRGIVNRLLWMRDAFALGPDDRVMQKTPTSFDVSVWELFAPLVSGARLVIARPEGHLDSAYLADLVAREGVTTIHFVPPMLPVFLAEEGIAAACASLRRVIASGEALPFEVEQRCLAVLPEVPLFNLYGPTEAAVEVTAWRCRLAGPAAGPRPVPIGRPLRNTRIHLADPGFEPAPLGAPGELLIGGVQVARGYLGRPDLTAERFVPDPWSGAPGGRLYRTGDLARHLAQGEVEFLGRIDHQIKVRGFRIEPGEIETQLASHPEVAEAVVVARRGGAGAGSLLACVVPRGAVPPDPAVLRDLLAARLPAYMVPAGFAFLDRLPHLANGKVDRRALSELAPVPAAAGGRAPRTSLEELLAGLCAEVLEVERVGVEERFFDLGAHSLTAMRLVARVREALGVELPVRVVFEAPTVAGLAAALEAKGYAAARPPLVLVPRRGPLPLSFAQERLFFLDRLERGSPAYHMPAAVRLFGPLDRPALAAAFSEVVRRHEALRTTFRMDGPEPVQIVEPAEDVPLPVVDLQGLPEPHQEAERLGVEEARRPFDLARGPLLRVLLIALAPEEHRAQVTCHHIAGDGWSMGVLVREIGTLYAGGTLPELSVQYPDYAVWQRSALSGLHLLAELSWWKGQLGGAPEALDLPTDRPRPAVLGSRGAVHEVLLDTPAVQPGTTLFMMLLAGFAALLARHAGQDDLVVATPVAGRTQVETEPLIGLFANTLALRVDLAGDPSFSELLGRVRETTLAAYAHQELPFERLVEELAPRRDLSRPPLAQVMLVLQNAPASALELPGLTLTVEPVDTGTAKFELTLTLTETERGLTGAIEYNTDLFEAATVARLAERLARLLVQPDLRVSELPLLSDDERRQILVEWNDVGSLLASDATLHQLFEAQAARTPSAVALVSSEERWTYAELDAWADTLAHRLADLGVGPEVRVGVCLKRTPFLVASLLAVLKAGGAYVPLDPAYPRERLAFLLEDSGAAVLATEPGLNIPETQAAVLLVEPFAALGPRLANRALPGNLAYLIYTSGSTGRPKGVAIEHRSVVAFAHWARTVFGGDELAGVLASTSASFDLSVFELFVTLAWGGTVVLAADALELPRLAAEVTIVNTVPSAMAELVRAGGVPASVRTVNLAGEPLSRSLADAIHAALPGVRVLDLYGPSEATTYSTWAEALRDDRREPAIGRPIAGTRAVLLGRWGEPVPAGVAGELLLGGAGLARGYLDRPDLTAERFVPDPFAFEPGARLYRTGDLARFRPDGQLEYLGRIDHQVKVRGFRIELGEIEAALRLHPGVADAAVVAREGTLLAALVGTAPAEELQAFLRERLPEHMVPGAWVSLPALPLTPNGKVDRKALVRLWPERETQTLEGPRTAAEEKVARIFAEVLGIESVGVHESFFTLGGHSLSAMRLAFRMSKAFGVELPVRTVFEAPTVASLTAAVATFRGPRRALERLPLVHVGGEGMPPLSSSQERLWFLDQLEPGGTAYNMPAVVRLTGSLDLPALARAFAGIIRRHEALRTTFATHEGRPVQVIAPAEDVFSSLPVVDLTGLGEARRDAETRRLAVEEAGAPFDLERGPLVRTRILTLSESEHVLLFTLHHAVSDGWSMALMVQEIVTLYSGGTLPELPIQYADYAVWQREWLSGEALEQQLAYWRRKLADLPPVLDLPVDRPRPAVRSERGTTLAVALPADLAARLADLSRRSGATLFMTLLAAFQTLLARATGEEDVPVGSVIANRTRPELEGLIGFFANTLVLRGDLAADPRFDELLGRTRETLLEAYAHQDLPFEKLVEELRPERSLAHSPLFQVMLVLQNVPRQPIALPGLTLEPVELAGMPAKFDLRLLLEETPAGLAGTLGYSLDLFDEPTMSRLLGHFERLLRAVAADPGVQLSRLPLLDEAERHQLLVEWNDTAGFREDACLQDLFETQAARTPDAVAVVFEEESLSFGELDRRSARLARHLARRGVGPESRVAICIERSSEMVVVLLGILRAGAAYVPLDPAHPHERRTAILDDLGPATILLTREDVEVPNSNTELRRATPDNAAYVIYTSGSTGKPKGVVVEHRQILGYLRGIEPFLSLGGHTHFAMVQPLAVDSCKTVLFPPLLWGGTLHLISKDRALDARALSDYFGRHAIDVLKIAPSHLAALEGEPLPRKRLFLGGEASRAEWTETLAQKVQVLNHYGPTETTVAMLTCRVEPGLGTGPSLTTPLGRPHADARVYLLDRDLQPVPMGVTGEIWVGGPGVSRGYLDRPDLTAERFLPDLFAAEPGARLYRTGDLARYLADGRLEFLGRTDHQVKIRGFRIELGEITAELCRHPGVRDGLVTTWGEQRLVGYLVPRDEAPTAESLRLFLRDRLPEYMVPAAFVVLAALPRTGQGKVDRKALPPPVQEAAVATAPRTPVEEILAGLFADVLRRDRVGIEDSFFELGGHSLLAIQLVSRVREAFDVELPVRAIFEAPAIASLAVEVEALRAMGGALEQTPLLRADRQRPLPLSFAQERLWFLDQLDPASPAYNLPAAVRLSGPLSRPVLAAALTEIVRRHESLRTTFGRIGPGEPVQVIAAPGPLKLPVVDLSGLPAPAREPEELRLANEEAQRPFDLERGPLLRVTLVATAATEHAVLLTLHHIVGDAWSTGLLVQELGALYTAFAAGQPSPLPELDVQYADFAYWQRQWLSGAVLERQLAWWREQLAGALPLELPADRPRPAMRTARGGRQEIRWSRELSEGLAALARHQGATPFMTLLAGLQALVARYAGQPEVSVGTPIAGR
ncbi:MAG TPA: amino acid adenylation domain-containing protein, partial [Thermoanaerobaculia bacterium]|nr:amino acid adenylation domain-containing protein [Thermoanaerobaculia bacterium]